MQCPPTRNTHPMKIPGSILLPNSCSLASSFEEVDFWLTLPSTKIKSPSILTPNMISYAVLPSGGLCLPAFRTIRIFWKISQHTVISCWFGIVGSRCPNYAGPFFVFGVRVSLPQRLQPKVVLSPHWGLSSFFCSVRHVFPTNTAALSIKLSEKGSRNVQHGFLHFCICRTGSPDEIVGAAQDGLLALCQCGRFLLVAKSKNTSHSSHNRPRDNTKGESATNFTHKPVSSSWRGTDDATRGLDLQVVLVFSKSFPFLAERQNFLPSCARKHHCRKYTSFPSPL